MQLESQSHIPRNLPNVGGREGCSTTYITSLPRTVLIGSGSTNPTLALAAAIFPPRPDLQPYNKTTPRNRLDYATKGAGELFLYDS